MQIAFGMIIYTYTEMDQRTHVWSMGTILPEAMLESFLWMGVNTQWILL